MCSHCRHPSEGYFLLPFLCGGVQPSTARYASLRCSTLRGTCSRTTPRPRSSSSSRSCAPWPRRPLRLSATPLSSRCDLSPPWPCLGSPSPSPSLSSDRHQDQDQDHDGSDCNHGHHCGHTQSDRLFLEIDALTVV